MDNYTWLKSEHPAVAEELEQAKTFPPLAPETKSEAIEMRFDDVQLPLDAQLPADFRPDLLTWYVDGNLIFVKVRGEVLLNRLPDRLPMPTPS